MHHPTHIIGWVTWNTFLAFIPVTLGWSIYWLRKGAPGRWGPTALAVLLTLAWLAFLPNTCYLLTEWRHYLSSLYRGNLYFQAQLNISATLLLMIYTMFYFCYSGIGMIAFALAIRPMARLVQSEGGTTWVWGLLLFILVAVGVYLGLVLRFNSWDLLSRPQLVWAAILSLAARPVLGAFIVAFAGFLWVAYFVIDIWVDGVIARWERIRSSSTSL
jgi:uncharacterized membrane protein